MNKVILVGNLGRDAEVKTTSNTGKSYASLSVATSESWRDKHTGEKRENTQWHRVVCWGEGLSKFLGEHAKKGGKVLIEGTLQTREWDDKGTTKYTTEVVVQGAGGVVRLLGRPGSGGPAGPDDEPDGRYAGYD
jgi:single-strand DNA-binding protein